MTHLSADPKKGEEVVIVLPCLGEHLLMQLRDDIEGIVFPGMWGFFSGTIDRGETPIEAMRREMLEELNYAPDNLQFIAFKQIDELDGLISHIFVCELPEDLSVLHQQEGLDMRLATVEEIETGSLYSERMGKAYPIIPVDFIVWAAKKAREYMARQTEAQLMSMIDRVTGKLDL